MSVKEIIIGLLATLALQVFSLASVGIEEVVRSGFVLGVSFVFAFSCAFRVLVASAVKEEQGGATDWGHIVSYALGAAVATGGVMAWYFL